MKIKVTRDVRRIKKKTKKVQRAINGLDLQAVGSQMNGRKSAEQNVKKPSTRRSKRKQERANPPRAKERRRRARSKAPSTKRACLYFLFTPRPLFRDPPHWELFGDYGDLICKTFHLDPGRFQNSSPSRALNALVFSSSRRVSIAAQCF